MQIIRLYADANGESRLEDREVGLSLEDFAPPAAPLLVSVPTAASRYVIIELPIGWAGGQPHPSPSRQMLFCLSGSFKVTASSGKVRSVTAGDGLLLEDTTGKRHITEVTSTVPV